MKKLKLSRSKPTDVKQQKISNFFVTKTSELSGNHSNINTNMIENIKQDNSSQVSKDVKESKAAFLNTKSDQPRKENHINKYSPVKDKTDAAVRKVGQLCSKCLEVLPKSEVCNSCNKSPVKLSGLSDQAKDAELSEYQGISNKPFKRKLIKISSPDEIPPTPPACTKKDKISKSVKRKCNFTEINCTSNKILVNNEHLFKLTEETPETSPKTNSLFKKCQYLNSTENQISCETSPKNIIDPKRIIPASISSESVLINTDSSQNEHIFDSILSKEVSKTSLCKEEDNGESPAKQQGKLDVEIDAKNCQISNVNHKVDLSLTKSDVLQAAIEINQLISEPVESVNKGSTFLDQCGDLNDSFLNDLNFCESAFSEPLKLDDGPRCKVLSVEKPTNCTEVVLTLRKCDADDSQTGICVLRGSWINTEVSEGDVVCVTAVPLADQEGCWVIDNDKGQLVVQPDTLVSGTTIVGSLFCQRRSVLSDMYRGIDADSPIMMIGSFLHELLQEVLKKKVSSIHDIKQILKDFISSPNFVFKLFSCGMTAEKTVETLEEFVPKIHAFVQKYIKTSISSNNESAWNSSDSWRGTIADIADIEENIWTPKLGIKGKVDVTVKTVAKSKVKIMPLELKTGRASFSAEHKGQVILYTMMMTELGQTVDSGLLLYLREGVMKEVRVGSAERRDLMMLRNQLVTRLRNSQRVVVTEAGQIAAPALPPPIHHHSACSKCPYLTLCSAAIRVSGAEDLSESNPLHGLSVASTDHIQMQHILYVFHWTGLLRLEHIDTHKDSAALQDIWTIAPAARKKRGSCVPNVKLYGKVREVAPNCYEHVFEQSMSDESASLSSALREGDYLIVSCEKRPAVAAGPLRTIEKNLFTLHLERDLTVRQKGETVWHLDKYESQSGLVFNMSNLACLLDNTEKADRLRKAVIDLELPKYKPKLSGRVMKLSLDLVKHLNPQQTRAIYTAFAAEQYLLIKGMPGTGKTATLVALIELAVRLGLSVLITSHTHSAVDNVLLRLRGRVDFLRLGASHRLHPQLAEYGEKIHGFKTPQELKHYYNSKSIVAVTCQGSSHPLLIHRQFDLCLVDEATQVLQPTVLRPLYSARTFILIGDPNQLPPLVRSSKAKELGLGQSLFARLDRSSVTVELSLQYRMNQELTKLANTLTYYGKLKCANEQVANASLVLPSASVLEGSPGWMTKTLSQKLSDSVIVLDTGVAQTANQTNQTEADIVIQIASTLKQCGVTDERIGVIAPYRAQVEMLQKRVKALSSDVEVNTVDQYQGRDKDVIIYSCTRSAKPTESDILGDKNRLTVAITRARHKLIIIGNVSLLRGYQLFNQLFNSLSEDCIVSIT